MIWLWNILKLYVTCGIIFQTTNQYTKLTPISTFCETLFYLLTFILSLPFLIGLICVNLLVRSTLTFYFNATTGKRRSSSSSDQFDEDDRIELMNGNDSFWAYDVYANSCNFTSLLVMEGNGDLDQIRKLYAERVINKVVNGELFYGVFRKIAITKFGYYCWQNDACFDLKNHIRYFNESNPYEPITETNLFKKIQSVLDFPLSSQHPQWEFRVVPHYVYDDPCKSSKSYFALVIRMHHSFTDGICAGYIVQNGFADSPPKLAVDPLKPMNISLRLKLLMYVNLLIFGPRNFFRTLQLGSREQNCFHSGTSLQGPKVMSWSKPINIDALKRIRIETNSTTSAIFLSSMAGALRKLALRKNLSPPSVIHAFPTIAILPYPNMKPQNRFTVAHLPTPVGLSSSLERLSATLKACKELERKPDILMTFLSMKVTGLFPIFATKYISNLASATMLLSNIPGPIEYCTVFGGGKWIDMSAWAPIRCGTGIGVGFFSYAGKVRACVLADASCLSDTSSDVSNLIEEFEKEIIGLSLCSGVTKENVFV